jgi:hypothetical protein
LSGQIALQTFFLIIEPFLQLDLTIQLASLEYIDLSLP